MTKKYILVGTMLVLLGTSGCSYIPTENISYDKDNQYTSMVLLNAVNDALTKAEVE